AARPQRHTPMNDTATLVRIEAQETPDLPVSPGAIVMRHLNFRYGKTHALTDVSMTVPANAVTAIIGPSGCGKSTLLRTINRIYELYPEQHASGEILIDGRNVLDRSYALADLRRLVGMVFQK